MMLLFIFVGVAVSAQIDFFSLERIIDKINIVLEVQVTDVQRQDEFMTLSNGRKGPMVSSVYVIEGEVIDIVYGEYAHENIKMKYTQIVPVQYNEDGHALLTFSYAANGSGIEGAVEKGATYLCSFNEVSQVGNMSHVLRIDFLDKKQEILDLKKIKSFERVSGKEKFFMD